MKNKAVFFDRDGTINEEMGYINHPSRFKIFPFVGKALGMLKNKGYKLVLVTNQAGVARGYFSEDLVTELHIQLQRHLSESNVQFDKIYYCPHHPIEGKGKYKKDCECRKPKTGMITRAQKELGIDLSRSYMIGDRYKDMLFARKIGLKGIMVLTGYGNGEYTYQSKNWEKEPDYICRDLLAAAHYIIEQDDNM